MIKTTETGVRRYKFFQRHCIVARILNSFDYVLFLDSDVSQIMSLDFHVAFMDQIMEQYM
ncbi:hypothetical protein OESDEN_06496 [Oesophagostomum dentatum]|uniref:Nucleotide-diphospho-sugar transferase domain-containing protein n=1 Tax=Oesophagostomum dentatum TaxID=61180 RepID=A0A0B1TE05_OESDE|nr:hypothetical protein OESDEN_06496 [Oesophagostomum dentatum]